MFTNLALRGGVSGGLFSARARSACLLFVLFILFYSQGVAAHGVAEGIKGIFRKSPG
jgi:SNF family Na+-dependent transporter